MQKLPDEIVRHFLVKIAKLPYDCKLTICQLQGPDVNSNFAKKQLQAIGFTKN